MERLANLYPSTSKDVSANSTDFRVRLVLETLTPLTDDRKCFRMINGVLVEMTVSDVLPALQTNADGLKKVLEDLVKQYRTKQEEMEKWKVRFLISVFGECEYR